VEFHVSRGAIEELLEHFVSAALGLTLEARIQDAGELPRSHQGCLTNAQSRMHAWAAWCTDRGMVSSCADYDHEQAQRIGAHVLLIEWWISHGEHHKGWWHCYPTRPREWIKGPGSHPLQRNY
jgi:hypothetical protein